MNVETFGVLAVLTWCCAVGVFASAMSRREAENHFELLKSKASHPAGKRQNRQT